MTRRERQYTKMFRLIQKDGGVQNARNAMQGLREAKLAAAGKIKLRTMDEFLKEL